jgi:hypothetical protein
MKYIMYTLLALVITTAGFASPQEEEPREEEVFVASGEY